MRRLARQRWARHGEAIAALLLVAGAFSACSDDDPSQHGRAEPWRAEAWIRVGMFEYTAPPAPSGSSSLGSASWNHAISGFGRVVMKRAVGGYRFYADVDAIAGSGTVARLESLDTSALRARYAQSLTDPETMRVRLFSSPELVYPLQLLTLAIDHYEEDRGAALIEDPAQTLPLGGAVVLPVGADPAVPANPELSALIAELLRFHVAWEVY